MSISLAPARRPLAVAMLAGLTVFGVATSASAATAVTYNCQASALGQTGSFTVNASVTATAPSTVAAKSALTITESVGSITVPTSASGYTVKSINTIKLKVPVPTNSTYNSATLSGGSNYGSGKPSVSEASNVITISIPGPINAGTTFTLPTLTLKLTSGSSGTITSSLSGTSYSNPGLTFTAVISVIGISVNASAVGYPSTTPSLTSTTIG